jgi:hypothetical protein
MQSFLMRQGIEERDYAREIPRWIELAKALTKSDEEAEQAAFEAVLGLSASKSVGSSIKEDPMAPARPKKDDATKIAEQAIARSRKAYGYLYAALPSDLRPLIADVPQGYAYGIWSYLDSKFRNTEQDSVLALWRQFATMTQTEDESYDEYKARVDSMKELLTNAKQKVEPALYASLLLWNLTAKYSTVVLSLKTSEKLKNIENIDWSSIRAVITDYERSHNGLGQTDASSERGMAARGVNQSRAGVGYSQAKGKRGNKSDRSANASVVCYRCGKDNHRIADCYSKTHKDGSLLTDGQGKGGSNKTNNWRQKKKDNRDTEGTSDEGRSAANYARRSQEGKDNDSDNEDEDSHNGGAAQSSHSYCARVLSGLEASRTLRQAGRQANVPQLKLKMKTKVRYAAAPSPSVPPSVAAAAEAKKSKVPLDILLRTVGKAIDTGATAHMTGNRGSLSNLRRCVALPIKMADGNIILAYYKGDMHVRLLVDNGKNEKQYVNVKISDVYYDERFDANLLSWGKLRKEGWKLSSSKNGTYLKTPKGRLIIASTRGDLTIIEDCTSERAYSIRAMKSEADMKELLAAHRRLGHISWTRLVKLSKSGSVVGIPKLDGLSDDQLASAKKQIQECEACVQGKSSASPVGQRGLDKGTRPGQVLHMDTFYVTRRNEITGQKMVEYCMLATDGYSEWRWASVVSSMNELTDAAISITQHCKSMTDKPIRMIICDLGSEFNNKKLESFCNTHGIKMQPAPPRVKQLNGLAEKSVDTVKNHTRAMLHAAGIKNGAEYINALTHHIYQWNRTHIGQRSGVTPYEAMMQRKADTSHTGEFGCDAFIVQHRSQRDTTFSAKAEHGIYLGHDGRSNCARIRLLSTGKLVVAKDVRLREGSFTHLDTYLKGQGNQADSADSSAETANTSERSDEESDSGDDKKEEDQETSRNERFEVEKVVNLRVKNGTREFKVKWAGYEEQSWEPASVIEADAPERVREYRDKSNAPVEGRVLRSSTRMQPVSETSSSSATNNDDADSDTGCAIGLAAIEAAWCL